MALVVRLAVIVRVARHEPVDDDLDRVPLVLVERLDLLEVELLPVDPDAHEALAADGVEDAVALRLAVADKRSEHQQPTAIWAG